VLFLHIFTVAHWRVTSGFFAHWRSSDEISTFVGKSTQPVMVVAR
jgi:hypothetical protein